VRRRGAAAILLVVKQLWLSRSPAALLACILACGFGPAAAAAHASAWRRFPRLSSARIGQGLFYIIPGPRGLARFRQDADEIGIIAPQSFSLDGYGILRSSLPDNLREVALEHGVPIMPLVINSGFSRWQAIRLLNNPSARDRAIGALVDTARNLSLAGWQVDFENMPWTQRAAFSRFVAEAADALHRHGLLLSVAVAARTTDRVNQTYRTFSGVYDYRALARSADFLSVMAYPESDAAHPGPLASTPWVRQVLDHVLEQAPPDKISLGIPTYQTDWMRRRIRISFRRRIAGHIRRVFRWVYRVFHHDGPVQLAPWHWDPVLQAAYRVQTWGHDRRITWIENEESFRAKLSLVAEYHLRGYSVWRLGLEDPNIWQELPPASRAIAADPPPPGPPRLRAAATAAPGPPGGG
jgi:spore germination protein YaaH